MSEQEKTGMFSCNGTSWTVGALLGFVAYLILRARYESGFILALIVGLVVMAAVAVVLRKVFCAEVEETEGGFAAMSAKRAEERRAFEAERAAAKSAAAEPEKKPAPASPPPAAKPAAKPAEKAPEPAAEADSDGRPAALDQPREGGADDLKMIKGVGPKLEQLLNSLGIYHFDQIAAWGEREVAWMDENLKGFKGRVSRDDWVAQAKVLAEGGTTAFANKVKKGDVY